MIMSIAGGVLVYGTSKYLYIFGCFLLLNVFFISFVIVIAYTHFFAHQGEDF